MGFIRDKERELRSVKEIEKIDNIIDKYVDLNNLLLKSSNVNDYVTLVKKTDDIMILTFAHEIKDKKITLFTTVSDRYIEFSLDVIQELESSYPPCTYKTKIKSCSLAMVKRDSPRIPFEKDHPRATHISVSKVRESESELRKSISVQVIIKEYVDRIEGYDLKKVVYKTDDDIPLEVQYVIEKGEPLCLSDLTDVKDFIKKNSSFFAESFTHNFKSNLEVELKKLSSEYRSLMVLIVDYSPLTAEKFPVCYLMLATRDRQIAVQEFENRENISEEISDKIRKGNYKEFEIPGKVLNLSMGGALVELQDPELIRQLSILDGILFNLVFKLWDPIRISASVVHLREVDAGVYHAGLQFKGSYFGPEIKKVIEERLKSIV